MATIRKVDPTKPNVAALLNYLQLEILPHDVPDDTSTGHWWVMWEGETPIGFCGMRRSARWCDTGYLCRAGVMPSMQGKGLQKRLIRVREKYARKLKWRWLISDTTDNPASANSLISCGFKMFTPTKPWGFDNACYWRKRL